MSKTGCLVLGMTLLVAYPARSATPIQPDTTRVALADSTNVPAITVDRATHGRSGELRVVVVPTLGELNSFSIPAAQSGERVWYEWKPLLGTQGEKVAGEIPLDRGLYAPSAPGVWRLSLRGDSWRTEVTDITVITRVPFEEKRGSYLNGYHIGRYPTEGSRRSDEYATPGGFMEVTPANKDLQLSEHFRVSQFLTKDQFDVWPKYLAVDLQLIDKLELVLQELNAMGIRADRLQIMSGFRTPQYNGPGGEGRARLSRHMYGDAADVWVDNDGDGWIDDLNGDGKRDIEDVKVMLRAVDRVERRYPQLKGGAGLYLHNSAHGPFIHIDARGEPVRW